MLVSFPVQWILSNHTGTVLLTLVPKTLLENLVIFPAVTNPNCRHTTRASKKSQLSSHTVPHWPSCKTSTLPTPVDVLSTPLLTSRTSTVWPLSKVASVNKINYNRDHTIHSYVLVQITPASLLVLQKVSPQPEWAQNWMLVSFPRHATKSNHRSEFSVEGG